MQSQGLGRNFWLFVSGRFVSQLGWGAQDVAIPLYVLDKTHSGGMMAVFLLAEMLPLLVFIPIAGVIGDRYNRKNLMVTFDLVRGAILLLIIMFNLLSIMQLLAVTVVIGSLNPFFGAATNALFPELVKSEELERANSIVSASSIIARLIGPALGGLLYGIGGIMLPLMVNGVSFFGSGLFEIAIKYRWITKKIKKMGEIIKDMKEGFSFLRKSKYLITLIGLATFLNALGEPFGAILMPYSFREILKFSSLQFGLLESSFMAGAFVGNMVIAVKVGKKAGKYLFHSFLLNGLLILIFIWIISPVTVLYGSSAFFTLVALGIAWGSTEAFINVPLTAKIQRAIPNEYRSRVFSTFVLLVEIVTPVGFIVIGPLLDAIAAWIIALGIWVLMAIVVVYYWVRHRTSLIEEE